MALSEYIQELVNLQQKLLRRFNEVADSSLIDTTGDLSALARKKIKPKVLVIDDETWVMEFHGVGVCFKREPDGVEVDFDKYLNQPNSFSPWRLATYLESLGYESDHNEIRKLLDSSELIKVEHDRYELRA